MFHVVCPSGFRLTKEPVSRWVAEVIARDNARFNPSIRPA